MPRGIPRARSLPPRDGVDMRTAYQPRDARDLDELLQDNPFLAEREAILPNIKIPGYATKWIRVMTEGRDDGQNIVKNVAGHMRWEYVRPEEVPEEFKALEQKHPQMGGSVIQCRDVVLMKTKEILAAKYRFAMQKRSDDQRSRLRREVAEQGSHPRSGLRVEDDQEDRGRGVTIDEG